MFSLYCPINEFIGFLAPQNIWFNTKIIIIGEKLKKLLQVLRTDSHFGRHLEFDPFPEVKKIGHRPYLDSSWKIDLKSIVISIWDGCYLRSSDFPFNLMFSKRNPPLFPIHLCISTRLTDQRKATIANSIQGDRLTVNYNNSMREGYVLRIVHSGHSLKQYDLIWS